DALELSGSSARILLSHGSSRLAGAGTGLRETAGDRRTPRPDDVRRECSGRGRFPVGPAPAQVSTMLRVASADELYARALDHGATSVGEPVTDPYGERQATVRDPWGHMWTLSKT